MKCFEKLVLSHIRTIIPPYHDKHQFAYRSNRSAKDTIASALHSTLTHLEEPNNYVRMLFVDVSSAFNTVISHKLVHKLDILGFDSSLCAWVLDILTDRPQQLRIGDWTSSFLILNTGIPQGCVLSPLFLTLFTLDRSPIHSSNSIIKFADDTTVMGLRWNILRCKDNNLVLNTKLRKAGLPRTLMVNFYRRTAESILSSCITVWYASCTGAEWKDLQ